MNKWELLKAIYSKPKSPAPTNLWNARGSFSAAASDLPSNIKGAETNVASPTWDDFTALGRGYVQADDYASLGSSATGNSYTRNMVFDANKTYTVVIPMCSDKATPNIRLKRNGTNYNFNLKSGDNKTMIKYVLVVNGGLDSVYSRGYSGVTYVNVANCAIYEGDQRALIPDGYVIEVGA